MESQKKLVIPIYRLVFTHNGESQVYVGDKYTYVKNVNVSLISLR